MYIYRHPGLSAFLPPFFKGLKKIIKEVNYCGVTILYIYRHINYGKKTMWLWTPGVDDIFGFNSQNNTGLSAKKVKKVANIQICTSFSHKYIFGVGLTTLKISVYMISEFWTSRSFHHSSSHTLEVLELSFIDLCSPYFPRVLIYMIYEFWTPWSFDPQFTYFGGTWAQFDWPL